MYVPLSLTLLSLLTVRTGVVPIAQRQSRGVKHGGRPCGRATHDLRDGFYTMRDTYAPRLIAHSAAAPLEFKQGGSRYVAALTSATVDSPCTPRRRKARSRDLRRAGDSRCA